MDLPGLGKQKKLMNPKGWYDPKQTYFIVEFLGDLLFALTPAEEVSEETWGMFDYGICAVTLDRASGIRFHRLGVPIAYINTSLLEASLAERLAQAARTLKSMAEEIKEHSADFDSESLLYRRLNMVSEMLTQHQDNLVASCMQSYRSVRGSNH